MRRIYALEDCPTVPTHAVATPAQAIINAEGWEGRVESGRNPIITTALGTGTPKGRGGGKLDPLIILQRD